jgi:hypothetical protein
MATPGRVNEANAAGPSWESPSGTASTVRSMLRLSACISCWVAAVDRLANRTQQRAVANQLCQELDNAGLHGGDKSRYISNDPRRDARLYLTSLPRSQKASPQMPPRAMNHVSSEARVFAPIDIRVSRDTFV